LYEVTAVARGDCATSPLLRMGMKPLEGTAKKHGERDWERMNMIDYRNVT
jgi:hypothetical protein